jgi:hypothetical protein
LECDFLRRPALCFIRIERDALSLSFADMFRLRNLCADIGRLTGRLMLMGGGLFVSGLLDKVVDAPFDGHTRSMGEPLFVSGPLDGPQLVFSELNADVSADHGNCFGFGFL